MLSLSPPLLTGRNRLSKFILLICIEIQLIYNAVLASAVPQSGPAVYKHTFFFRFFPTTGCYKVLNIALCAIQRALLLISSICSRKHRLTPSSCYPSLSHLWEPKVCFHTCEAVCFVNKYLCHCFRLHICHTIFVFV